jgi:Arabinose-binding domain of AraC transcription regulator, N-term
MPTPAQPAGMISSRVVVRTLDFVAARGHDPEQLCRSAGLHESVVRDPAARVPFAAAERLQLKAAELCGDPNIGLHLAQDVSEPRVFDAGVLLMMSSPTLRESLERMARYQRYWADGERYALRTLRDGVCIRYQLQEQLSEYQRQCDECALAELVLGDL